MEIVGVKWREVVSNLYQIPFNLGHLTLPCFAYFIRDWHYLQLALSLPSVILISYYWLIPESPRWLFAVGRIDEASAVLEKSARMNKLPTEDIHQNLIAYKKSLTTDDSRQSKGNILDLFRTPNMRTKTLCISFNWLVCGLGFFGVAQYIGQAHGNIFTNVAVSAIMGIPGTFACIYTTKRFGRKRTMIFANALVGVSMLSIAFIPPAESQAIVAMSWIGIVGITVSFPTAYLYACELFPTGKVPTMAIILPTSSNNNFFLHSKQLYGTSVSVLRPWQPDSEVWSPHSLLVYRRRFIGCRPLFSVSYLWLVWCCCSSCRKRTVLRYQRH